MKKQYIWRLGVLFGLIAIIFSIHYTRLLDYFTLADLKRHADFLYIYAQTHVIQTVLLYCALLIGAVLLSLPITILLTIAGGFLFGTFIGAWLAITGVIIGGSIIFIIIRYLLGDIMQRHYSKKLQVFNAEIRKHGAWYLLMMQLLPVTPTIIINLFAGLSPISLWTYIWTTALGILPGTLVYTFAGQQLHTIDSVQDIMSWQLFVLLCLLAAVALIPIFIKRLIWP